MSSKKEYRVLLFKYSNTESSWASPPRTITSHMRSIDGQFNQSSPKSSTPTTSNITVLPSQLTVTTTDIKPIRKIPSNHLLPFAEQFENEVNQIRDEFMLKFSKDQKNIEQEISILIDEERHAFNKLNRYLNDRRRRLEKRHNDKRKHKSSSSTH